MLYEWKWWLMIPNGLWSFPKIERAGLKSPELIIQPSLIKKKNSTLKGGATQLLELFVPTWQT